MKTKLELLCVAVAGLAIQVVPQAPAQPVTQSSAPGVIIPDNNLNGVVDKLNLSAPFNSITAISVNLDITGGYDGDYYAYLRHGTTGFAVLLDRIGQTPNSPFGSSNSGFDITLIDGAPTDVHGATAPANSPITGSYQPDGPPLLGAFKGMNPNGTWTLFIADVSPVGIGTLTDWSVTVNGSTVGVPDAGGTAGLLMASVAALIAVYHRRARTSANPLPL